MTIETVDELANQICDWVGCYGGCKHTYDGDGCTDPNPFCCRIGAMFTLPDRICKAVENDNILDALTEKQNRQNMKEVFVIKLPGNGNSDSWYQETNQHGIHLFPSLIMAAKQYNSYGEAFEAVKPLLSLKEIGRPCMLQIEKYFTYVS